MKKTIPIVGILAGILALFLVLASPQDSAAQSSSTVAALPELQKFSSAESLVDAYLPVDAEILSISETGPDIDESIKELSRGGNDPSRIVDFNYLLSSKPITSAEYTLYKRRTTVNLGHRISSATMEEFAHSIKQLGDVGEVEIQKLISMAVSQNIVSSQRTERELRAKAKNKITGEPYYLVLTYTSALKPDMGEVEKLVSEEISKKSSGKISVAPDANVTEKVTLAEIVNNIFKDDEDYQVMNERIRKYWAE
jgi:hypothetical protein